MVPASGCFPIIYLSQPHCLRFFALPCAVLACFSSTSGIFQYLSTQCHRHSFVGPAYGALVRFSDNVSFPARLAGMAFISNCSIFLILSLAITVVRPKQGSNEGVIIQAAWGARPYDGYCQVLSFSWSLLAGGSRKPNNLTFLIPGK